MYALNVKPLHPTTTSCKHKVIRATVHNVLSIILYQSFLFFYSLALLLNFPLVLVQASCLLVFSSSCVQQLFPLLQKNNIWSCRVKQPTSPKKHWHCLYNSSRLYDCLFPRLKSSRHKKVDTRVTLYLFAISFFIPPQLTIFYKFAQKKYIYNFYFTLREKNEVSKRTVHLSTH